MKLVELMSAYIYLQIFAFAFLTTSIIDIIFVGDGRYIWYGYSILWIVEKFRDELGYKESKRSRR